LEVGGDWTCHRGESERGVDPLKVGRGSGGPPPENFEILDGRRCNLGIYLRKIKLLIDLKNAGFLGGICVPLEEKLKKSKLVKMPQNWNRLTMP
jgi:hypothetical protein